MVFPRRAGKPKAGDAAPAELQTAAQLKGKLMPLAKPAAVVEKVKVTAEMKVGVGGWDGVGGVGWVLHIVGAARCCCCSCS